ncbi:alkaline phosphatase [Fictibacillus phosphorivorans]|uniref:Alkaline phosphatase n=1 Tax=Fictibacillus phosphorivorans TaxID=1221500 RepID=A0A160ISJ4_9BACL|nr:alkaline phosphatase [Fictibacillus phosphorivorans]ANC79072.1 alkaline phosphatase [Fictibacillus phosphorivorans]
MTISKKVLSVAVAGTLAISGLAINQASADEKHKKNEIKNVIFLIGDGMGPTYTTAYRAFKDNPKTPMMEETKFDDYLVGMQSTYSHDKKESVTDSAAAATSMSAGIKTYNGAIAVDMEKQDVKTVLEQAKQNGKSTGLVATSQINHATPAAFGAHDESRENYNQIADDYYDDMVNGKHKVDVILGGGTSYFERKDRNITDEFKKDGYSYVTNKDQMLKDDNEQILGLFAPKELDKKIDRPQEQPSLKEMTNSALDRLNKNDKGFFLMVEGSQIDWAGHDNDVVAGMSEMEDFEQAFQSAIEFAKKDKHTLVITTADHSTGGMTMGRDGDYKWDPSAIKAAKKTPDYIAKQIANGAPVEETLKKYIDLELTPEEVQSVKDAKEKSGDVLEIDNAIEKIFDLRTGTGWTTDGHTGEDVNVYAYGSGMEKFSGKIDNTDTAKEIFSILEKSKSSFGK